MVNLYLVGGAVRDLMLGQYPHDYDFTVEAASYEEMEQYLVDNGFEIFVGFPEYYTIRGRFPRKSWKFAGREMAAMACDFVLARRDGVYSDNRRPDSVMAGSLLDDLRRRDFTVNAMAQDIDAKIIDPFSGQKDLQDRILRAVGSAEERLSEDPLRALRAIRFAVTKGFTLDFELVEVLHSGWIGGAIETVAIERVREEMLKAFQADTIASIEYLNRFNNIKNTIFRGELWLNPTLKKS